MLGEIINTITESSHLLHRKEDSLSRLWDFPWGASRVSLEGILRGMQMGQQKKGSLNSSALDDYPGHRASAAVHDAGAHTDNQHLKK